MEILGGPLYSVAGAGESHGPAISTIVHGCPPGLLLQRAQIQHYLDRRRPGGSRHGTPRNEKDKVVLLSGLFQEDAEKLLAGPAVTVSIDQHTFQTESYEEGFTTGEPIAAMVLSTSKKSGDYTQFLGATGEVRPGHTDLVKHHKSGGFVDVRGGGRSSYRATITDVIGGSIARIFLRHHFQTAIVSSIRQIGKTCAETGLAETLSELAEPDTGGRLFRPDVLDALEQSLSAEELHTVDAKFANEAADVIKQVRSDGDSVGALLEVAVVNVPPLIGEPLYQSLKFRLMGTLGGLHAVQSVEVGAGRDVVTRHGSENNDPIRHVGYQANSHGGLIGGMTTGMPLFIRVGFKPTSTINKTQQSVRKNLEEIDFSLAKGRHDPCVGVRAGVTLESRVAIELLNAVLMHQASRVDIRNFYLF